MSSNIEKLERLAKLRDSGALSLSEFEMEKRKLLSPDAPRSGWTFTRLGVVGIAILAVGALGFSLWRSAEVPVVRERSTVPEEQARSSPTPSLSSNTKAEPEPVKPPPPVNPWIGEYSGTFEGDAKGSLSIKEGTGGRLKFSLGIGAAGCIGGLEATMAVLSETEGVVAMSEDESGKACRVTLKRSGSKIALSEEGCSYYHGFECSFVGTVKR